MQGPEVDAATDRTPVSMRKESWLPDAEVPVQLPSLDRMIEDAGTPLTHISSRPHFRNVYCLFRGHGAAAVAFFQTSRFKSTDDCDVLGTRVSSLLINGLWNS